MSEKKRLSFAGYSFKWSLKKVLFRDEPPRIGRYRKYVPPPGGEHVIQRFNYIKWELLQNIWLNWAWYVDLKEKENAFVSPKEINQYTILKHTEFTTCFMGASYMDRLRWSLYSQLFADSVCFFLCLSIKGIKTIYPPGTIYEFDWNPCTTFTEGSSCTDMLVSVCFAFL